MAVSAVTVKPDCHVFDEGIAITADQINVHRVRCPFQFRNSLDLCGIEYIEIAVVISEVSLFCLAVTDLLGSFPKIHDLLGMDIDGAPEFYRNALAALLDVPAFFLSLVEGTPAGVIIA